MINEAVHAQIELDILKLVVVNRYYQAPPAIAFIKNFGLKRGAIASSVAHDSHNVIAVGVERRRYRGGDQFGDGSGRRFVGGVCRGEGVAEVLPLPVAGLMATGTCEEVGHAYGKLDKLVKALGFAICVRLHDAFVYGAAGDSGAEAQRSRVVRRGEV